MNKADIVAKVKDEMDMTRAQAERTVETVFECIVSTVANGSEVSVAGFGIFEPKKRAARMGRNPRTGESLQIQASISPKFRAAKAFKDRVNR